MSDIFIGDIDAQVKFKALHPRFFEEEPSLQAAIASIFSNRDVPPPTEEELSTVRNLPEENLERRKIEDRYAVDALMFAMGRIAVDDFTEIIILAANGFGVGALKILRGLYERVVTSVYIANNPQMSKPFMDERWIYIDKAINRAAAIYPEFVRSLPEDKVKEIRVEAQKAKAKKSETVCKCCLQIKRTDAYTQVTLDTMASKVGLGNLYGPCYLEPTMHMHATTVGVESRFQETAEGLTYKMNQELDATKALQNGHRLMLINLDAQNQYFHWGLTEEIQHRRERFRWVWEEE